MPGAGGPSTEFVPCPALPLGITPQDVFAQSHGVRKHRGGHTWAEMLNLMSLKLEQQFLLLALVPACSMPGAGVQ